MSDARTCISRLAFDDVGLATIRAIHRLLIAIVVRATDTSVCIAIMVLYHVLLGVLELTLTFRADMLSSQQWVRVLDYPHNQ